MICLLGKSGSGKTTICNHLISYGMEKVVTYTTRKPRDEEIDGIDYHFISKEEFENLEKSDFFIETMKYTKADEGDVYYGTSKSDVLNDNDNKVIILTPSGLKSMLNNHVEMYSFYLKCNENVLGARLVSRKDNEIEIFRRLKADNVDFNDMEKDVDFVIRNDLNIPAKNTASCIRDIYETILGNNRGLN